MIEGLLFLAVLLFIVLITLLVRLKRIKINFITSLIDRLKSKIAQYGKKKNLKKLPHLNLKIDNIRAHIRKFLPKSPGIYIFSVENTIIYIGKANSLVNRVLNYFGPNLETKPRRWLASPEVYHS